MNAISYNTPVLEQRALQPDIRLLTVAWPHTGHAPHAGQFFMLRGWGAQESPSLSRPISVHEYDAGNATLRFLYQVKGEGTQKLAALRPGDPLNLVGPCGNGFPVGECADKKVAVVGGGIGMAPLLQLCRELYGAGARVELYAGFREEPYALGAFLPYCRGVYIATDSGAAGYHGLVTELLHPEQYELVLTCGPMPMMYGVAALCAQRGTRCLASLERKMACGLGACLGCSCKTKVGYRTVCKDGPVFPAEEVFNIHA